MDESLAIETQDEQSAFDSFYGDWFRNHREYPLPPIEARWLAISMWVASRNWHRERNEVEIEAAADRLRAAIRRRED